MNKCLVLFVEGETEIEFYRRVVQDARNRHPDKRFDTAIEYRNVQGIGGFKNIALRKFINDIKPKYNNDTEYTIGLCYDTDVFDFAPKPPINWCEVEETLIKHGASNIIHIKAKRSIEDWFLYDLESILKYLRLSQNTKVTGKNGYDKLQRLFRLSNKVYFKGLSSSELIDKLDIKEIVKSVENELMPLYLALGVNKF